MAASWVAALGPRGRCALAAGAGLALTVAQPPVGLWPLLFPAWSTLLLLLHAAPTTRSAVWTGWWAGTAFFTSGLYWVGEAFLTEAWRVWWYLPLMPVAVALLGAGLALFWAAAFWAARRWPARGATRALALAFAVSVAELARGSILTGFPWALQAYVWVDTPALQAASLMGAHALSALTVLIAAAPAVAGPRLLGAAAVALALCFGWGGWRLAQDPGPDGPLIRVVQPNVAQRDKWDPANTRPIFDGLLALSGLPGDPAMVIWPEVAVTFFYDEIPEAHALTMDAMPPGAALAVGAVRRVWPDDPMADAELRNSLLFFDGQGAAAGVYDKAHLTPFGEYVPYAWLLSRLGVGRLGVGLGGLSPGPGGGPVALPGLPPFTPLICYEIIFPAEAARAARGADWIIQATNDAWFGDTGGPRQHLAQARVRAVELGLPVARAANTGISAMIDAQGRIRASLPLNVQGALDSPLPARAEPTLFSRVDPNAPFALWAIMAAGVLLGVKIRG
jgi:apolipoprotein N-acyltransferase